MKIVFVSADSGVPILGNKGASVHVRELTRALHGLGNDVNVLTARSGRRGNNNCAAHIREVRLAEPETMMVENLAGICGAGGKHDEMVREIRALLLNRTFYEVIESIHQGKPIDCIYERYSLWSFAASSAAKTLGIPYILEVNSPLFVEQERYRHLRLKTVARGIEEVCFRQSDAIVAVSEEVRDYARREGVSSKKIHVVPNAVDPLLFNPATCLEKDEARTRRELPQDSYVVGFLGSLKSWHGIRELVEAMNILWADHPDFHLLLVGNGPLRGWVEELMQEKKLSDRITITGEVPYTEIPSYLACMDVAVAPYGRIPDFYFSPMKIFEYMSMARPIIASGIGQIEEILGDGETGLLTPPGDIPGLAGKILYLRYNPDFGRMMGDEARRFILERNRNWNRNAEEVICIAKEICGVKEREAVVPGSLIS